MICPNCETEIQDNDSDFCPYCGNRILCVISGRLIEYHKKELKKILDKILITKIKNPKKSDKE